jgi:type IV pilus assembly protein PilM
MVDGLRKGKSKNRVGLDIGNQSVKMVELTGPAGKPGLVSFGLKKIAGSSRDDVVGSIRSLAEELRISAKDVNISVSGPSLIVRLISMPKMTDEELAGAVRFEAEKFIPFDINDCILDFQILDRGSKDKSGIDILLAAAKKDYVWQKIKTVEKAGFAVRTVDVDIFAIMNSFLKSFPSPDQAKTSALLNIGATSTDLSILRGNLPVFVRELSIGSGSFIESAGTAPAEKTNEAAGPAKPAMSNLVDEVRLSFGYHENQSGRGVDEIYVSGGGAGLPGLKEAFTEAFGQAPFYWDPFQSLDKSSSNIDTGALEKAKSSFCVAVGLALRG